MAVADDLCAMCVLVGDEPAGGWVLVEQEWAACVMPGFEVPGWLVVIALRHVESLADLDDEQQRSLGLVLARLSGGIRSVLGAEKVYLLSFGENHPHLHLMLMSRMPDLAEEYRGPEIVKARERLLNVESAYGAAAALRELLR